MESLFLASQKLLPQRSSPRRSKKHPFRFVVGIFTVFLLALPPSLSPGAFGLSPANATTPVEVTIGKPTGNGPDFAVPVTLSGFESSKNYLAFVSVPESKGTVAVTPNTVTAVYGYDSTNFSRSSGRELGFRGTLANVTATLDTLTYTPASDSPAAEIAVSITEAPSGGNFDNIHFFPDTGHYYEWVQNKNDSGDAINISWTDAKNAAEQKTLFGMTGYLATITSKAESDFAYDQIDAPSIWIGATDRFSVINTEVYAGAVTYANQAASESNWYWVTGPASERVKFWEATDSSKQWKGIRTVSGAAGTGKPVLARFNSWREGEPNDFNFNPNVEGSGEHFALANFGGSISGSWNDFPDGGSVRNYLVEYGGIGTSTAISASASEWVVAGAPTGLTATPGNLSMALAWTAPDAASGGEEVTSYQYSIDNGATWVTTGSTATSFTATGLSRGTQYTFRVRAMIGAQPSASSTSVVETTWALPGTPQVSSITLGVGQLSIAFTQPTVAKAPTVTNYEYSTNNGVNWTPLDPVTLSSPAVITGLDSSVEYAVKLRAVNGAGESVASSEISGRPMAAGLELCSQTFTNAAGVVVSIAAGSCVVSFTKVGTTSWTVPQGVTSTDYLIIAGGGGGGSRHGGGGGAGGFLEGSNRSIIAGDPYSIVVGAGGSGASGSSIGTSGANSSALGLNAIGGGRGGGGNLGGSLSGGSGGGSQSGGAGAAGTSGQGFDGGQGRSDTNNWAGGGGGGAGAVGVRSPAAMVGGDGGAGKATTIRGSEEVFAAGGGGAGRTCVSGTTRGGAGGVGGGGNGGCGTGDTDQGAGKPATAFGSGGGAGNYNPTGANRPGGDGFQGLVVVRFTPSTVVPIISAQPANQSKVEGEAATFSFTVQDPPAPSVTSQKWQVSVDGGSNWTDVVGGTGASLTVSGLTLGQNTHQYRVVLTRVDGDLTGTTISNAAVLSVASALEPIVAGARCDGTYQRGGIRVAAGHGSVFYIDTGQGQEIDAGYLAYKVSSTTSRSDLWVEATGFTGGVVTLADPTQGLLPLGAVTGGASGAAYFMIKATGGTTTPQAHSIRVYDRKPTIGAPQPIYECSFTFVEVAETIKAAANKVQSITSSSVARIGSTMTITVQGDTGTIGQGNRIDGRVISLTPAARSDWPTQALRLESTSAKFYSNNQRTNLLSEHVDILRINAQTLPQALSGTNRQYYTIVYTFRVIGSAASTAPIIPVAMISSGTQMKHTDVGSLPTGGATTVDLRDPDIDVTLFKDVDTTTSVSNDGSTTVSYTMTLTNRGTDNLVVDEIIDTPDSQLSYVGGTARLDGASLRDPGALGTDRLGFSGPFGLTAGQTRTITYDMRAITCAPGGTYSFTNTATAQIGAVIIGSSTATKSLVTLTGACGVEEAAKTVEDVVLSPEPVTGSASALTTTTATISGTVDSNGVASLPSRFKWATTSAGVANSNNDPSAGLTTTSDSPTGFTADLTGLTQNTTYYYRIEVYSKTNVNDNTGAWIVGEIRSFTTDVAPVLNATPEVATTAPTAVKTVSADLTGTVNPKGVQDGAKVLFEWKVDTNTCQAGTVISTGFLQEEVNPPSDEIDVLLTGTATVALSYRLLNLTSNTGYCYRIVSVHGTGPTRTEGNWVAFTTVEQLSQTITWVSDASDPNRTAGETLPAGGTMTVSATATSGLAVTYGSVDTSVCTVNSSTGVVTAVPGVTSGTCVIRATQAGGASGQDYYESAVPSVISFEISAPIVTTKTLLDGTYGQATTRLLAASGGTGTYSTWSVTGLPAGMSLNTSTGVITGTPTVAGTYVLTVTVTDSNQIQSPAVEIEFFVAKALLTVTASSHSVNYGSAVPTITPTYAGFVAGDTSSKVTTAPSCSTTYAVGANATTTWPTTCRNGWSSVYTLTYVQGQVSVTKLGVTIVALDAAKQNVNGQPASTDPTFSYSASSLPAGQTMTNVVGQNGVTFQRASGEDPGTYAITPSATATSNYNVVLVLGTLTIQEPLKVPRILVSDKEISFGTDLTGLLTAQAQDCSATCSNISGGTYTYTDADGNALSASDELAAGDHSVIVRFVPAAGDSATYYGTGNGEIVTASYTITVTPTVVVVQATNKEKRRGALDPSLAFSVTNATENELSPVVVSRTPGETPGNFPIQTQGGSKPSFVVNHVAGTLYIYSLQIGTTPTAGAQVTSRTVTGVCAGLAPGSTARLFIPGPTQNDDIEIDIATVGSNGSCSLSGSLPDDDGLYALRLRGVTPLGTTVNETRNLMLRTDKLVTPTNNPGGNNPGGGRPPVVTPPQLGPNSGPIIPFFLRPGGTLPPVTPGARPGGSNPGGSGNLQPPVSGLVNTFTDQAPRLPGVPGGIPGGPVAGGAGAPTIDLGTGVTAPGGADPDVGANSDGNAGGSGSGGQGVRSVGQMAEEKLGGFYPPGSSTLVEILGARSAARFVVTEANVVDTFALIRAVENSIPTQAADFFALSEVRVAERPQPPAPWTNDERDQVNEFFAGSGLDNPLSLADINVDAYSRWVAVSGSAQTYAPGTVVYLTVTSQPLIIGSAVVGRDGFVEIAGAFPADWLTLGEHRVRLVGIRALDGVSVDDQGEVQLSDELMTEIQRFDLGTQSTIAVIGSNESGGQHTALRVVPLVPEAPWWTLWLILAGFLLVGVARYRGVLFSRGRRMLGGSAVVASAVPAVILGWLSTVSAVVWWAVALGLVAGLVSWFIPERQKNKSAGRRAVPAG